MTERFLELSLDLNLDVNLFSEKPSLVKVEDVLKIENILINEVITSNYLIEKGIARCSQAMREAIAKQENK